VFDVILYYYFFIISEIPIPKPPNEKGIVINILSCVINILSCNLKMIMSMTPVCNSPLGVLADDPILPCTQSLHQ
jgi:hypothetical protein